MLRISFPFWVQALCAGLTAFGISLGLTPIVRQVAIRCGWVSKPVDDRWGKRVIARLGGVAMFAGFTAAALIWVPMTRQLAGLLAGISLVFVLGLADDIRRLPPYTKLIGQLLVGCLLPLSGIRIELISSQWLSIPLSVLWFVLIMNAFNLLDNMDGLAAGIGALSAAFCAFHAVLAGQWLVVSLSAVLCGVCLGFLRFNFPPARIYMGDSGSHVLGLTLGALALLGSWKNSTQLLSVLAVPVLVLAVPIFDTCFVTIERLLHGFHPFTGGTDHVSHRLAILGLNERQTALALYGISALLGGVSIFSVTLRPVQALVLWLAVLVTLILIGQYLGRVNVYRIEQPLPWDQNEETHPATFIETMLLHKRRLVEVLIDFCSFGGAYVAAHLLRFEGVLSRDVQQLVVQSLPIILVVKLACNLSCGLYRGVWRYLGLFDVVRIFKSVTLGSVFSALALLYVWRFQGYSRAVLVIDWLISLFAIGGSRVLERLLDEWIDSVSRQHIPVLIIGAGDTGERVLRYLKFEGQGSRWVMGFLDDDPRKYGNVIHRAKVLGTRQQLAALLEAQAVKEVLVAINDPPGDLVEHVRSCCSRYDVPWKVVAAGITSAA